MCVTNRSIPVQNHQNHPFSPSPLHIQDDKDALSSEVAACAKSLSPVPSSSPLLPSAGFAAKAAQAAHNPSSWASSSAHGLTGPAFLVVTGEGNNDNNTKVQAVEAALRIHDVGRSKQQQAQVQGQQHHGLRGATEKDKAEEDDDSSLSLSAWAPTPECAAASQSVSHLYANGRVVPGCEWPSFPSVHSINLWSVVNAPF